MIATTSASTASNSTTSVTSTNAINTTAITTTTQYEIVGKNLKAKLRRKVTNIKQQYGFMLGKINTDAVFSLRILMDNGIFFFFFLL